MVGVESWDVRLETETERGAEVCCAMLNEVVPYCRPCQRLRILWQGEPCSIWKNGLCMSEHMVECKSADVYLNLGALNLICFSTRATRFVLAKHDESKSGFDGGQYLCIGRLKHSP